MPCFIQSAPNPLRAVWLCRYDPVSTAFLGDAAESLQQCELVVVQHLFLTETAKYAHVVLPTTAYGEERVTFTSTERRIQLAEQVIEPPPALPLPGCNWPGWPRPWEPIGIINRRPGNG